MTAINTTPAFVHHGLPSFMRARLREASHGGGDSYESAGFSLGRSLDREIPDDAEHDQWADVLAEVDGFLAVDVALTTWLRKTYPRILRQVPTRRLGSFVAGVRRGREEAGQ